jgi:methylglutaconyl-CoA hydratase
MAIKTEMRGQVLEVTLDRPSARNAFDGPTIGELRGLFEDITSRPPRAFGGDRRQATEQSAGPPPPDREVEGLEPRPSAVLLRAEGPVFCAGADLGDMERLGQAGFQENLDAALEMGAMFRAIRLCAAPVVARVQGPAYGGGVGLMCACDIVVADPAAKFAFSEVRLGLVAGVIAPLVIDRIGQAAARYLFLTGDAIPAGDALRIGMVDRLAGEEGLDETVAKTIRSLLLGGPAALGRIKSLVEGTLTLGFERSLDFTAQMIAEARTSHEAQAALQAFFRKDPAPWAQDAEWPPA